MEHPVVFNQEWRGKVYRFVSLNSSALGLTLFLLAVWHVWSSAILSKKYLDLGLGVGAWAPGLLFFVLALVFLWPHIFAFTATALASCLMISIIGSCRQQVPELPLRLILNMPLCYIKVIFRRATSGKQTPGTPIHKSS